MNRPNDFSVPFHHIIYGKSCLILYNIMNETKSFFDIMMPNIDIISNQDLTNAYGTIHI